MKRKVCEAEEYYREVDQEVARRRNELFQQYVMPFQNMIYKLVMNYTYDSWNVEENYNEVLINFFRRIETYDTSRPIRTWLHIVTKRMVAELERRRKRHDNKNYDRSIESYEDCGDDEILHPQICSAISANLNISSNCMGLENYRQFYNDDILEVLDSMKPIHRDAILLQEAGYPLREIADIEYKKGTLPSHNIETIKSRLLIARKILKNNLTRNGERITDTQCENSLQCNSSETDESDL